MILQFYQDILWNLCHSCDVLKKISQVGYVGKKGKSYFITDLGKNLVEIFPVKELFDVDYTGKLEKSLSDIQKGQFTRKEYLNNIMTFIYNNVELIKKDIPKNISTENYSYNPKTKNTVKVPTLIMMCSKESLGKCPVCQGDVFECSKGYICTTI